MQGDSRKQLTFKQMTDVLLGRLAGSSETCKTFVSKRRQLGRPPVHILPGADTTMTMPDGKLRRSVTKASIWRSPNETKTIRVNFLKRRIFVRDVTMWNPIAIHSVPWGFTFPMCK